MWRESWRVSNIIKLSSPSTHEYWEIPILFEDADLLALDKPAGLAVSPDRDQTDKPCLMRLLHRDIERGATWAKSRAAAYLANAFRLDPGTSGVLLLAKSKPILIKLAGEFGIEKSWQTFLALSRGTSAQESFQSGAKVGPNPLRLGHMRIDPQNGKRARTEFQVRERFKGYVLLECRPLTHRPHQIQVHLKNLAFQIGRAHV